MAHGDSSEARSTARRRMFAVLLGGAVLFSNGLRAAEAIAGLASQPLSPRSGPRAATMFAAMPPDATGLVTTNAYDDPRMWSERYHEFGVGAIGTGVAIGDYDSDGRPDVFVVSKVETGRLFRNLGGWKFEDVTERAGVGDTSREWKQGAAFVDVNNDGRLDLYVCRFAAPNQLFINQGDRTFREEAAARGLAVVDACGMAAFADYDGDGWLDVYLQTNLLSSSAHPDGQRDHLFRNRGDGTFENVTGHAGIAGETQGHSATWWDENEDGWPDLYVANDFNTPDSLYRNNRNGTFTDMLGTAVPHTPVSSMGADLGDVNNDGHIDLLVADMATTTHEKDQRGMADSRGLRKDPPPSGDPLTALQIAHSMLYLNTGTGRCLEAAFLAGIAASDWTWSPRWEDLDNDGRLDLHITNGMNREQTNVDLLNAMMIAETPRERARLMQSSPVLAEPNLAFRNRGDLEFENVGAAWGLNQNGVSFGSAFGDLDGDGDLDLVFTNYEGGLTALRNDSDQGHRVIVALRGAAANRFGVGASVTIESALGTQVRQLVLARGYLSTSEPVLHFGLGNDERIDRLRVAWPGGRTQEFADLGVDVAYTITEPGEAVSSSPPAATARPATQFREVSAELGLALRSREEPLEGTVEQPFLPRRFNRRGPGLAIGDLDGDDVDEIVVGATAEDPVRILRRNGSYYQQVTIGALAQPPPINAGPPLLLDVNGDGANDLLLTAGGAAVPAEEPEYEPRLLTNDRRGGLQPASRDALPSLPVSAGAAVAGDFDHDGRLDVFVGGRVAPEFFPEAPMSVLLANRAGHLVDVTDVVAPALRDIGMVTSALWSDVDDDGWIDLVVALEWGAIRYLHNENGRQLEDRSDEAGFTSAGHGWWTALASADFNGDGRPDFAVGNLGLNTMFRPTPTHPEVLFAGDFAGRGTPQLIDAYYEGERLVPRRSRRELGAKIPDILKRFPKNDQYAGATLEEILGADRLARATRHAVTEARSGVLLSQKVGLYHFVPLPRIAQIAPVQGLVAGDFDGDGKADLYAVQNSYEWSIVYGRFDGGLSQFLRGDGRGGFVPVMPAESGLVVPGDARALVVTDLDRDGWPDFVVTRNNTTALAFRNEGAGDRRMLRIQLRGTAGNPAAIGAQVQITLSDGAVQTREVQAGGGFGSQSTADCFFGCPQGREPREIRVRWPTGATSTHTVAPDATAIMVHQPAQ